MQTVDASQPKAIRMAESPVLEDGSGKEEINEMDILAILNLFNGLDVLLCIALVLLGLWFIVWRRRKQEKYNTPAPKSYSIQ